MDVRKWRDAYSRTVTAYFSTPEKIQASAERIAAIIDAKPNGYFYPPAYFGKPGFLNFTPNVEVAQRAALKKNLPGILATFACGTVQREAGIELQKQTSYGNWNGPGFSGFSTGQQDGSGDLIFQLLVAKAMPPANVSRTRRGASTGTSMPRHSRIVRIQKSHHLRPSPTFRACGTNRSVRSPSGTAA